MLTVKIPTQNHINKSQPQQKSENTCFVVTIFLGAKFVNDRVKTGKPLFNGMNMTNMMHRLKMN